MDEFKFGQVFLTNSGTKVVYIGYWPTNGGGVLYRFASYSSGFNQWFSDKEARDNLIPIKDAK
jgi:hypothetical protein